MSKTLAFMLNVKVTTNRVSGTVVEKKFIKFLEAV